MNKEVREAVEMRIKAALLTAFEKPNDHKLTENELRICVDVVVADLAPYLNDDTESVGDKPSECPVCSNPYYNGTCTGCGCGDSPTPGRFTVQENENIFRIVDGEGKTILGPFKGPFWRKSASPSAICAKLNARQPTVEAVRDIVSRNVSPAMRDCVFDELDKLNALQPAVPAIHEQAIDGNMTCWCHACELSSSYEPKCLKCGKWATPLRKPHAVPDDLVELYHKSVIARSSIKEDGLGPMPEDIAEFFAKSAKYIRTLIEQRGK